MLHLQLASVVFVIAAAANAAFAQVPEVEPNDDKATATLVAGMTGGQFLDGNSVSATASGLDYWRVSTAAAPPGIYRHELTLTTSAAAGHTGSLRGLNQIGGTAGVCPANGTSGAPGTTDTVIQTGVTTSTPPRVNAWYGFGKSEQMYYRVTGTTSTTANYNATLTTTSVVPMLVGTVFNPGPITMLTIGQTTADTDIYLFDSNFNIVMSAEGAASNDDEHCNPGTSLQSRFVRTLGAGTYYLAIGAYNTCSNLVSPTDDDYLVGALLDFPDSLATSISTVAQDRDFQISDGTNTYTSSGVVSSQAFEILWARFNVGSPSVTYCTGKLNSQGCVPSIAASGAMSATASSGFVLSASNELNNKVGLVIYSEFGRNALPFGAGGILCVKAPARRSRGMNSGGNPPPAADCSGVLAIDFNTFARGLLGTPPSPGVFLFLQGQVVTAQFWGSDPGLAAPNNFSLSNAIEFSVGP